MNLDTLLDQFLAEAGDLLDLVDTGLLALERDPGDRPVLDEVFRAAHTLKGSSGLFDLPALTRLNHAAEDLLDAVRGGRISLTAPMIDDLLAAFDLVRAWIAELARTRTLPLEAAQDGAALGVRLRAPLGGDPVAATVPGQRFPSEASSGSRGTAAPVPGWLLAVFGAERVGQLRDWLVHARTTARVLRLEPVEGCFFSGDDPLHLIARTPAVEALDISPRAPWPGPEEFDEYRCLLVFTLVTRATRSELDHLYRYVPDEVEIAEVDADGLSALLDGPRPPAGDDPARVAAGALLAAQLQVLRADIPADQVGARLSSVAAVTRSALAAWGRPVGDPDEVASALAESLHLGSPDPLTQLVERELAAGPEGAGPGGAEAEGAEPEVAGPDGVEPEGGAFVERRGERPDRRTGQPDLRADPVERRRGPADRRGPGARMLKVEQATVDRLLDLVGQLVVAKNGLPFLAAAAEQEWNARPLGRRIKDQYGVVNRISEELQTAVMDVRMLPLSTVFARFPRLVRDLSRSLGKQVELVLEGEDTAADKDIIEMLGDPLVHLIRNALDHGVEAPAVRVAAGKPAGATVRLRAAQEPDAVVIDVVDDGRGVDPATIRAVAYQRGLLTEEELAALSDEEAVDLIFRPGFSTAERISDVSGRGVGMDAVRASVVAAGGSVRIVSTPGQGSRVRLRMPLSMAISQVMIVTVGRQRFGVPVDLVIETVRVPTERVVQVEHQPVIVLRDTVVPLIDLVGTLQLPIADADPQVVSVLVTRVDGAEIGLVVDAFHEGAEVIVKPMEGLLAGSRSFCGTALMGDGSVLLVLDVKEVLAGAGDGL